MATSSQNPVYPEPTSRLTDGLAPVAEALMALVAEFADLPRPYVVLHTTGPAIGIQLDNPSHFEAWRQALTLSATSVELKAFSDSVWLAAAGQFRGVAFNLTGHGVPLSAEQVQVPQLSDESSAVAA